MMTGTPCTLHRMLSAGWPHTGASGGTDHIGVKHKLSGTGEHPIVTDNYEKEKFGG